MAQREPVRFVLFVTLLAVVYGVAHDLVTAHVAVEYFTVYHPRLIASQSPIVMALMWGFLATFWVGGIGGLAIALANTLGSWPSVPWARLRGWIWKWLVVVWVLAMTLLWGLYLIADLMPKGDRAATFEQDRRLVAVASIHALSYAMAAGAVVVLVIATLVWRRRAWRRIVRRRRFNEGSQ